MRPRGEQADEKARGIDTYVWMHSRGTSPGQCGSECRLRLLAALKLCGRERDTCRGMRSEGVPISRDIAHGRPRGSCSRADGSGRLAYDWQARRARQSQHHRAAGNAARQSGSESPSIKIGKSSRARADGRAEPERRHEPWMIVTLAAF